MLKAEVKEVFRRSKPAAELGSLGIVLLTVGFLRNHVSAAAYLLHQQYHFSLWASWGIIGSLFLLVGHNSPAFRYILFSAI